MAITINQIYDHSYEEEELEGKQLLNLTASPTFVNIFGYLAELARDLLNSALLQPPPLHDRKWVSVTPPQ